VAVGLGGDERAAPARGFRRALDRARASGLGVVVHAGEGTSPAAVREAVDVLGVSRIAHGVAAVADPALLERLARGGVLLEICPTSNVMTGAARGLGLHPLPRILAAGVRVALGSDDRTIFGTTLRREYARAAAMGVPDGAARAMVEAAAESSFAPAGLRRRLVRRIRAAPPAGG
jgi:adenosine deaminase